MDKFELTDEQVIAIAKDAVKKVWTKRERYISSLGYTHEHIFELAKFFARKANATMDYSIEQRMRFIRNHVLWRLKGFLKGARIGSGKKKDVEYSKLSINAVLYETPDREHKKTGLTSDEQKIFDTIVELSQCESKSGKYLFSELLDVALKNDFNMLAMGKELNITDVSVACRLQCYINYIAPIIRSKFPEYVCGKVWRTINNRKTKAALKAAEKI